jgi:hypothetical protein
MARSISQAQLHALNGDQLDLIGDQQIKPVQLNDIADTLAYLAALYTDKLGESLAKADASSSGVLADSIIPLDVKLFGSVYTVEIQAAKYAKFIDEGVDGWAKSRGSQYKFKTKGVDPNGEMVKSIKAWLLREGSFSRNVSTQLSKRESRQKSIVDATTKRAISTAYMIKRQGIRPTKFWQTTTKDMARIVETELAKALKVDIINSIVE